MNNTYLIIFNRFLIILCLLACFLFGCTKNGPTHPTDILSDKIIINVSERLNKKYGLKLIGIGGAVDEGLVWNLDAIYGRYSNKILDKEEARAMIIDCTQEFLNEANNDEEFRPYMRDYPFTPKNLSLSILNHDENNGNIHFPEISDISLDYGIISYSSLGPEVKLPYAQEMTETFEEALKLYQTEKLGS